MDASVKTLSTILVVTCVLCPGMAAMFPASVTAVEGEEVMFRLEPQNLNQTSCILTLPNATVTYMLLPADNKNITDPRIRYWGAGIEWGDCGFRISNVSFPDSGFWRLTSLKNDGRRHIGAGKIHVIAQTFYDAVTSYDVLVGSMNKVHVGPGSGEYCQVVIPGAQPTTKFVPGSCSMTVNGTKNIKEGNWSAHIGIQGKTNEVPVSVKLFLREEGLDIGWKISNASEKGRIDMYCNLRYSKKRVSFCRFVRLLDEVGFRLSDGLGNGKYSYFGNGLQVGDCGLTIENPSTKDYGIWKCILGVGTNQSPMASFLAVHQQNHTLTPDSAVGVSSEEDILALVGTELTILCRAERSLIYCWFRHPNGTNLFPGPKNKYGRCQYYGAGLQMGECGIKLMRPVLADSGQWVCHMGAENLAGRDIIATVNVNITTTSLITKTKIITTAGRENIMILCLSVPRGTGLVYCRFVRPDNAGFSLDQHMKSGLFGRYYYHGDGLENGECGLHVHGVQANDFGKWTCAGRLQGEVIEASDIITVTLPDGSTTSTAMASILGIIVLVVSFFVIFKVYKRYLQNHPPQQQEGALPEELEMMNV